jgi:chromosome condensin MukBEF ATPase and DNA-binding subunit MukB
LDEIMTNSTISANEQLARQINKEARTNPSSPYSGKFVGLANGQIVVVADSWQEVSRRLRQMEPDPQKCWCLEASADYDRVEEIWSAR